LGRETIFDPSAERAVLAGVFRYGHDAYLDAADLLTPASFHLDSNQAIWRTIGAIFDRDDKTALDLPTVHSAAEALGYGKLLQDPDELRHLRAVMNMPVERSNVRRMAAKVRKLEIARQFHDLTGQCQASLEDVTGDEPVGEIVGRVENPIFDLTASLAKPDEGDGKLLGDGLAEYVQYLEDNETDLLGLPTGFPQYDELIGGGLRRQTVNVVCARPGVGKSTFAICVALEAAVGRGVPVLYLDTEMGDKIAKLRALAHLSKVNIGRVARGKFKFDPDERARVYAARDVLATAPITFRNISGGPFDEALGVVRRWVSRGVGEDERGARKDCLLILDYIKLTDPSSIARNVAEHQAIGFMVTALHDAVVKYDITNLSFVQLARGEDVAQSDRILWLASSLAHLKLKSPDETAADIVDNLPGTLTHKLHIKKARHGPGLRENEYINVAADLSVCRMSEGPRRVQEQRKKAAPHGNDAGTIKFG
jgi:replicative DNA helicase